MNLYHLSTFHGKRPEDEEVKYLYKRYVNSNIDLSYAHHPY